MAYVVTVKWRALEGEEDAIREILDTLTPLVRGEEGCLMYVAHKSVDDQRDFFLYEQYIDEPAFIAHTQADHFNEYVLGRAVPKLESRERGLYTTMD